MTPDEIKRAAFLLQALEDIQYDLSPTEDESTADVAPLGMDEAVDVFQLQMSDDEGSLHTVATIDRGMGRFAMQALVHEIERELAELGVRPDGTEVEAGNGS